jgi:hypothetical protein
VAVHGNNNRKISHSRNLALSDAAAEDVSAATTKKGTQHQRHSRLAPYTLCRRLPSGSVRTLSARQLTSASTHLADSRPRRRHTHAWHLASTCKCASVRGNFYPHVSPVTFFFPCPFPASSTCSAHCLAKSGNSPETLGTFQGREIATSLDCA